MLFLSNSYAVMQLVFEGRQIRNDKWEYLNGSGAVWNFLDITTSLLVLAVTIMKVASADDFPAFFIITGIAVFLMWLKLFYFLRLFKNTAAFIRMIVEMIKDIRVFLLVFFIAIFAFANAYAIFDRASETSQIVDGSMLQSIIYTY